MSGEPDPLYVLARRVLLDGLQALGAHREAIILVGAQAIYLHTGDAELAVAPFTTDSDLVLDPTRLQPHPLLEQTMAASGFRHGPQPGIWLKTTHEGERPVDVALDLLVPEGLGGGGRRGARLPSHGDKVARKARGLEAALVDNQLMEVRSFEADDLRCCPVLVASPSALLVAKLHKLGERMESPERLKQKDAYDILRLLCLPSKRLASGFHKLLAEDLTRDITSTGLQYLETLFGQGSGLGSRLAAQAAAGLEAEATVSASCVALADEVLEAMGRKT